MKGVEQIFGNIIKIDICARDTAVLFSQSEECKERVLSMIFQNSQKSKDRKNRIKRANGNEMQLQRALHIFKIAQAFCFLVVVTRAHGRTRLVHSSRSYPTKCITPIHSDTVSLSLCVCVSMIIASIVNCIEN